MIIIGSYALKHHGFDVIPKDIDFLYYKKVDMGFGDLTIVSKEIYDLVLYYSNDVNNTKDEVISLDALYTLKCSHLFFDNKWEKHKAHILLLKNKGCVIIEPLYYKLKEYWLNNNPPKFNLSLNKTKKDFFDDAVNYKYDHDYLHELVAFPNKPMYSSVLKDGHDVLLCKHKFDELTYESKIRLFREEISVIAIERWLIPTKFSGRISWYEAYILSLKKTIISLTKNWAQDFIIMNLDKFCIPEFSYFEYCIKTIGEIKMSNQILNEMKTLLSYKKMEYNDGFLDELSDNDFSPVNYDILVEEGNYEHVTQEGGGEGGTEYCFTVFEWKGVLYKMEYSYYSYDGYDFSNVNVKETKSIEQTVTVYE